MNRNPHAEQVLWHLVDLTSKLLEPLEREAVRGDFEEAGDSGGEALCGVLSLIIRRQIGYLMDWRPAFALTCLALPMGMLLSLVSRSTADGSAIYIWLYANNWDWAILRNPGFWQGLAEVAPNVLLSNLALVCWAGTAGFLLRFLSRRSIWLIGGAFFSTFLGVGIFGVPHVFDHILVVQRGRDFPNNASVFTNAFYGQIFPFAVEFVLVALPAWWGICRNFPAGDVQSVRKVFLLICTSATTASLVCQSLTWWQFRVWTMYPLRLPRLPSLMPLALVGPIAYFLLTRTIRHRRPLSRV